MSPSLVLPNIMVPDKVRAVLHSALLCFWSFVLPVLFVFMCPSHFLSSCWPISYFRSSLSQWACVDNFLSLFRPSFFLSTITFFIFLTFHLPPPGIQQQQLRGRGPLSSHILAEATGRWQRSLHHCKLSGSVVRSLRRELQGRPGCGRWEGGVWGKEQEEQRRKSRGGNEGWPQVSHLLRETPPLCRGHHGNLLHICLCFHRAFPPRWIDGCKWSRMLIFPSMGINPAVRKMKTHWQIMCYCSAHPPEKKQNKKKLQVQHNWNYCNLIKTQVRVWFMCFYVCALCDWILARHQTFVCVAVITVFRLDRPLAPVIWGPVWEKTSTHKHRQKEHVGRSGPERSLYELRCLLLSEPWSARQVCVCLCVSSRKKACTCIR